MDFVPDQLANGRRFRVLNVVDDFSREYVLKIVDFSISGHRIARELERLARSLPKTIVCDNVLCADVKRSSARATGWPRVRRPATSLHDFSRRSSAQTG